MSAARTFGLAAQDSKREVNWITFKDKSTGLWGFTYPGVAKVGAKKSRKPWQIRRRFDKVNIQNRVPNSLGHSHFDDNLSFSIHDLYSMVGQAGSFTLLNKYGDLSYVSDKILRNQHHLKNEGDVTSLKHRLNIRNINQDTKVYGLHLGNIYE